MYTGEDHLKLITNQIINQRSVPKIRQRVGEKTRKDKIMKPSTNGTVKDVDRNDVIDLVKTAVKIIGDLLKK